MPHDYRPALTNARLYELALTSPDVGRLTEFYTRSFGYQFMQDDEGWLGIAQGRRLRLASGTANRMSYAAYAVTEQGDLDSLSVRLQRAEVPREEKFCVGFENTAMCFADPDGNQFRFGIALPNEPLNSDSMRALPARLQHVVFASRNAGRMLDFYLQVMGFVLSDRVVDDDGGLRTAFVRCSDEHHSLAVFAADTDRLDHHCFEAGEWGLIRDWADHFAKLRLPLKWGPGRHGPGDNLFIFIHDPDGNWVEVSAELERVLPDRPVGEWKHEERTLNSWGIGLLRS